MLKHAWMYSHTITYKYTQQHARAEYAPIKVNNHILFKSLLVLFLYIESFQIINDWLQQLSILILTIPSTLSAGQKYKNISYNIVDKLTSLFMIIGM